MRNIALFTAFAALASAYIASPRVDYSNQAIEKRQLLATLTSLTGKSPSREISSSHKLSLITGKGGKVADPPGAAPKRVILPARDDRLSGVKRVKIRYGPYSVIGTNKTSITGESGMLWNYPDTNVAKPCTECTIVGQVAGLEYPDGRNANVDTGMWLHHMVHFTTGPGRWDPTCFNRERSLPHFAVGASPRNSERYFSSGNERTLVPLDMYGTETNAGYHLKSTDKYAFIVDLMNMNQQDVTVYMTMYYDFLEGPLPDGWRDVKTVWFDANQCGTSEVRPLQESGKFTIPSGNWTPNFEGEILGIGSHLHDGGAQVKISYGAGKTLCTSEARYGESAEFISPKSLSPSGEHSHGQGKHISSMSICFKGRSFGLPIDKLDPSQSWSIDGLYDYDTYEGAQHGKGGKQDNVMSIALMYVAVTPGGVANTGAKG